MMLRTTDHFMCKARKYITAISPYIALSPYMALIIAIYGDNSDRSLHSSPFPYIKPSFTKYFNGISKIDSYTNFAPSHFKNHRDFFPTTFQKYLSFQFTPYMVISYRHIRRFDDTIALLRFKFSIACLFVYLFKFKL